MFESVERNNLKRFFYYNVVAWERWLISFYFVNVSQTVWQKAETNLVVTGKCMPSRTKLPQRLCQ